MFKSIRLGWMKAQALTALQTAYEMPLKEPLDPMHDTVLKELCRWVDAEGGGHFDAAAMFMLTLAEAIIAKDPATITPDERGVLSQAGGKTLGLLRFMKKPDAVLEMTKAMMERSKAIRTA